ncbi:MAG: DUF3047 domain-containing protein [Planctomycetota bacterium]
MLPSSLLILLVVGTGVPSSGANEPTTLRLGFEREMVRLERVDLPIATRWKYYITEPRDVGKFVRRKDEYIQPSSDGEECRILSHENYVTLSRLIDEDFSQARTLSWKWKVKKHPPGGTLGTEKNDQSMIVYAVFRIPKDVNQENYNYHAIGFCWTEKTVKEDERRNAELPWRRTQKATIIHVSIQDGPEADADRYVEESVDLDFYYRKYFPGGGRPDLWGITLMGDSNDVVVFEKMTTDATIRDIRIEK